MEPVMRSTKSPVTLQPPSDAEASTALMEIRPGRPTDADDAESAALPSSSSQQQPGGDLDGDLLMVVISDPLKCGGHQESSGEKTSEDSESQKRLAVAGATTPGCAAERRLSFSLAEGRTRSRSVGERQWSHVRAVMAWYTRLRRIKKRSPTDHQHPADAALTAEHNNGNPAVASSSSTALMMANPAGSSSAPPAVDPSVIADRRSRSAQRWMKLRTTVQLTSAITSTIAQQTNKKTSLKREDSFIARFSTRQLPETQETFDATDEGGSNSGGNGGNFLPGSSGGGDNKGGGGIAQVSAGLKRRRRHQKPPRSVLNPDENGLFYWLAFLALWVLYNLWTIVVRLAFPELHQDENLAVWNLCDLLGDVAYLLDVAVQFRTGYLEQGIMVHDSKKLAIHYVRSKAFLIDMACMLPLDWMLLPQQLASRDPVLARWRPACRFFRLAKLYRVYAFYYVVESRTVYPNAWRVVNLVHILLMLAHWFGCFYFLLSESEGFHSDWSYPYPDGDWGTLTRKYLGSLYWSTLTLTTIGDLPTPETNLDRKNRRPQGYRQFYPQRLVHHHHHEASGRSGGWHHSTSSSSTCSSNLSRAAQHHVGDGLQALPRRGLKSRILHHSTNQGYIFTIASYLIGVFIFATIVGQVGNVITNRNASRLEFERLLDTAKLYMRHHKVPRSMQRRVQRWYDYSWSRGRIQGGGDTSSALRILPDKLKTELALHVNLATLKKVSIFKECQPEFLHDLVLKMRASIFTPGDMICRRGEVAREMFIIADGILEVISETGKVLTTMKSGDFFGEIGILNLDGLNKRTADVRSVGYAELFSLSREDVLTAMKDYPEAEEILLNLGRKRLLEARKAASQHRAQLTRKGLLAMERKAAELAAAGGEATRDQASMSGVGSSVLSGSTGQIQQPQQQSTASRLSDRIRSDVFGLKRAIRKSFKESKRRPKSSSPTKIELGTYGGMGTTDVAGLAKASSVPLRSSASMTSSIGSSSGGSGIIRSGLLRRMAHVASEDVAGTSSARHAASSAEDCRVTQPLLQKQPSSPIEVIGAGLPLFQRLKLLRQRELEKEKALQQQQQEQMELQEKALLARRMSEVIASVTGSQQKLQASLSRQNTAVTSVTVEIQPPSCSGDHPVRSPPADGGSGKSSRHITFSVDKMSPPPPPPLPPTPSESSSSKTAVLGKTGRWALAVLPGRSSTGSKFGRARLLEVIQGSGNESQQSTEQHDNETQHPPAPLPPPPPPLISSTMMMTTSLTTPPTSPSPPPFWQTITNNVTTRAPPVPPPPRPPLPALAALNRHRIIGKQTPTPLSRRAMTLRSEASIPEAELLAPQQRQQPKIWRSTAHPTGRGANSMDYRAGNSLGPPGRRFSRQNTIQVVSDVHGVLTDILLDIAPYSSSSSSSQPRPAATSSSATVDYGTMRSSNKDWDRPSRLEQQHQQGRSSSDPSGCEGAASKGRPSRPKRLNLLQSKNRTAGDYNSIDDLSPEYTVLPFVKRLKILNERQKIVELQRALSVVGPPDAPGTEGSKDGGMTGSNSNEPDKAETGPETSPSDSQALMVVPTDPLKSKGDEDPAEVSRGENDTPERVSLKKMLRSASRKELMLPQEQRQDRLSKLLRSQTVEGYAARVTNFTKLSGRVGPHQQDKKTIHRIAQTLPSPPPPLVGTPVPTVDDHEDHFQPQRSAVPFPKTVALEGSKEECVAELLTAIKTVLQDRLDEIQTRFQAQIQELQSELDQRDRLISELRGQLQGQCHQRLASAMLGRSGDAAPPDPSDEMDSMSALLLSGSADDEETEEGPLGYFARSRSKDSFIRLSTAGSSLSPPRSNGSDGKMGSPSVDDLLMEPSSPTREGNGGGGGGAVLNPEPLWQLEFGSCWHRMRSSLEGSSPPGGIITSNPRDMILDLSHLTAGETTTTSSDSCSDAEEPSAAIQPAAIILPPMGGMERSPMGPAPYVPDWEIQMLAHQSLDMESPPKEEEEEDNDDEGPEHPAVMETLRRRSAFHQRSATSSAPATGGSSSRSKKMISKWYWSLPPPRGSSSSSGHSGEADEGAEDPSTSFGATPKRPGSRY